ncbi:hypothetical protein ES702_03391 [subsurface metagenome]
MTNLSNRAIFIGLPLVAFVLSLSFSFIQDEPGREGFFFLTIFFIWGAFLLSKRLVIHSKIVWFVLFNAFSAGASIEDMGVYSFYFSELLFFVSMAFFFWILIKEYEKGNQLTEEAYTDNTRIEKLPSFVFANLVHCVLSLFFYKGNLHLGIEESFAVSGYYSMILATSIIMIFPYKIDTLVLYTLRNETNSSGKPKDTKPPKGGGKKLNIPTMEEITQKFKTTFKPPPKQERRKQAGFFKIKEEVDKQKLENELKEKRMNIQEDQIKSEREQVKSERERIEAREERAKVTEDKNELQAQKNIFTNQIEKQEIKRGKEQFEYTQKVSQLDNKLAEIIRAKKDVHLTKREARLFLDTYQKQLGITKREIDLSYKYQIKAIELAEKASKINLEGEREKLKELHKQANNRYEKARLQETASLQKLTGWELDRKASIIRAIEEDWFLSEDFSKIDTYNKQGVQVDRKLINELQQLRENDRQRHYENSQEEERKKKPWYRKIW